MMSASAIISLATLFLWKGETQYVWCDFTNASDRLVLVKPSAGAPVSKVGIAFPVRGDCDALVPDRVVWNASMPVNPGESVRAVAYPGAVDLDGYLRWAFCSWPANPNADSTYSPWFCTWSAGVTFLHYPEGPSLRYLGLKNGLNISEKISRLRAEGRIDSKLQGLLGEFRYRKDAFPPPADIADFLTRVAQNIQRVSKDGFGR